MKRLNVTVQYMAIYNSSIEVPDDMTLFAIYLINS